MIRAWFVRKALSVLAALVYMPVLGWAQYTSRPIDAGSLMAEPYRFTGIAMSDRIPCSGAVVFDTRLLLSASHCVFKRDSQANENPWRPTPEWFLRYHAATVPTVGSGTQTRGFWVFSTYADSVRNTGVNSSQSFDLDFHTAYAFEPLAEFSSGYWDDGYQAFMSQTWKQTVGYPSDNYPAQHSNKFLMHHNGPWTAACRTEHNSFVVCNEVSTGPGNSGGPVFVMDSADSRYYYAGTLVSGLERQRGDPFDVSGINLMRTEEWSVINAAKDSALKGAGNTPPPGNTPAPTPTPAPSGGQRLGIYGNSQYIPSGKSSTTRTDMTEFGTATGRRSLTRTFTLYNYGTADLRFDANRRAQFFGRGWRYFRHMNTLPSVLSAGQTYPMQISFRASPRGSHRALVYLTSNDPQTPSYSFLIRARRR
jgi:hypothetical protein